MEEKDFDFTYNGFLSLLNAEGINSKGTLRKAFNEAKTSDLKHFMDSINEFIGCENCKKDKITLKEFWDSKENLAIHCKTEEQAIILLKEFNNMGKEWVSNESYIEQNHWEEYRRYTCYGNNLCFADLFFYLECDSKIYEFEDIIFEI